MGPSETRYALLTRLAWELRAISASSLLAVPGDGEPVLWVLGVGGRKDAVLAAPRGYQWLLLWRGKLDAERLPEVAGMIAAAVGA